MAADPFTMPAWLAGLVADAPHHATPEALMGIAIEIAQASVEEGGGPFGALVVDPVGRIVGAGANMVLDLHDSTAHAEILAIRRAQRALATHDLAPHALRLFASCAPCIQCFGAIYWSGIRDVYSAATRADAEAIGFTEGPVSDELWSAALRDKGIHHHAGFLAGETAVAPLRAYKTLGGPMY